MGLTPVFDLAARALRAQELVLQAAGQNLANVNRPGYSRQEAVLAAEPPHIVNGHLMGSGVTVEEIRQVIDEMTEKQLLMARSGSAEESSARDELSRLETLFSDLSGTGVQDALDSFFAGADDLALHPQGIPERTTFLARAETAAARFRTLANNMAELQRGIDERIEAAIPAINSRLDEIARLNSEIFRAEMGGRHNANDLRDQRREALGELSELIGITHFETDRQVTVVGPDGLPLVDRDQATHIVTDKTTSPTVSGLDGRSLSRLGFEVSNGDFIGFSNTIEGGEVGGLLSVRDTHLPAVAASFDQLAMAFLRAVNAVHDDGEDLDGNAGGDLFSGTSAVNLTVLITDPRDVAASLGTNTPEDNRNARALAALQSMTLDGTNAAVGNADLGGATLMGFFSSLLGEAGTLSETAIDRAEAAESVTTELTARRSSISGVSTNEELLTLLSAQRAFQSASMMINAATAMLDALITMTAL